MHFGLPQFNPGMQLYGFTRPSYYSGFQPQYRQHQPYQPAFRGWQPPYQQNNYQWPSLPGNLINQLNLLGIQNRPQTNDTRWVDNPSGSRSHQIFHNGKWQTTKFQLEDGTVRGMGLLM